MSDFIFGFLIGRVIGGIIVLAFKIVWFFVRIVWWLAIFLILWAGAGVAFLIRGGRRAREDAGRFGRYLADGTGWRDESSGTVYPLSGGREYCEVYATDVGTYWRRAAISRLLRGGWIQRYRFAALTDPGPGGRHAVAAWCEFPIEARHNITLDHLDPRMAATDRYGLGTNREQATEALKHVQWLLAGRGWEQDGYSADPSNTHWYAARYSRPAISWDGPVLAALPARQSGGQA